MTHYKDSDLEVMARCFADLKQMTPAMRERCMHTLHDARTIFDLAKAELKKEG